MTIRKTITEIFMAPTVCPVKENASFKKKLEENNFIGAFSADSRRDVQYEDCVLFLFKPEDMYVFREFLDSEYERTEAVIDDYDYEGGYVVVVYKLREDFKADFALIRLGKYSKTSEKFQALFPRIKRIIINGLYKDELSLQFRIFNKTKDLVEYQENKLNWKFGEDDEVWQGFIEENETLNIDKIKEYVQQ
jgi:hypothetical protein